MLRKIEVFICKNDIKKLKSDGFEQVSIIINPKYHLESLEAITLEADIEDQSILLTESAFKKAWDIALGYATKSERDRLKLSLGFKK